MRVIIEETPDLASLRAAEFVSEVIRYKPNCNLGLATGSTPLACYRELIRMHHEEGLDFSSVTTFNLDEYVGLGPNDEQSYRYFMNEHLFKHINVRPELTNVPDGRALDFETYCSSYEQKIVDCGGIDLQVLGIGSDGHIAFNEPGSSLGSRTRVKTLTSQTIKDNARFFGHPDKVPRLSITMGVGTILESKVCLLIALGENKAEAVSNTIEGPVTAQVTASALQLHREVIVVLDEAAASMLTRREYYDEVEKTQKLVEQQDWQALGLIREHSS